MQDDNYDTILSNLKSDYEQTANTFSSKTGDLAFLRFQIVLWTKLYGRRTLLIALLIFGFAACAAQGVFVIGDSGLLSNIVTIVNFSVVLGVIRLITSR